MPSAPVPANIVSWYRAEGDTSDFVGGNDGTLLNGATYTTGKVGQAFLFDGVDDQVSVPDTADQNPGSQFTVEAWVNPSSSGHGRPIAQKRPGNLGGYTFETTHAPYGPDDGLQFVVTIGGNQVFLQTPAGVLTNNVWQHVAATYDGAALRIYVDGVERASAAASGAIDANTAPVVLGQNVVIPSFAWDGAIDEVSFYSRALAQAELQAIVDAGSEGKSTFPIAAHLYRADGNALDSVGVNHGTLQGGLAFAAGQVGQAFNFDGVNDSVDLGTWFNLQRFSLSMWLNPGATQTEYANIIDNNHANGINWTVQQDSSTTNRYILGGGSAAGDVYFNLTANTWQHLTLTRDTGGVKKVYIDGVLIDTETDTALNYNGAQFLRLGRWGGGGRNWNGLMDEVGIYDRALSAAEVQAIFTAEAAPDLQVTISDTPDPVLIGDSVAYTVSVTNHGPLDATGVVAVVHGPAGQQFNSVTIPVGDLPNGASSSFQLVFTPAAVGTFSVTADVSASEADSNLTNNSFTAVTQVGPRSTFELVQAHYEVREGESFTVLTIRRTGDLSGTARVDYTTVDGTAASPSGGRRVQFPDYTTSSGTLSFRAHANTAQIRVPIRDDGRIELDETFRVVLSNPSAGTALGPVSSAEVVIHDDDPSVSFTAGTSSVNEEASLPLRIEVRLASPSAQKVTVDYVLGGTATPGQDFLPPSGQLVFARGQTRVYILFRPVNDTTYEGAEYATLTLSNADNAFLGMSTVHTVSIVDNEPVPPPQEPGSTPETALFIDLQTLPRQSFKNTLIAGTIDPVDTFRVHLEQGEYLTLDVDPEPIRVGNQVLFPGLASSSLVISAADGSITPIVIGPSKEPDTGTMTNNPAFRFQAASGGDFLLKLETLSNTISGYRMYFHRIGVSENVPAPELLNEPGPMFAWFDDNAGSDDTVGITGPTGYGFTLTGPWQQTTQGVGAKKWQTLTLSAGSQFTLASPQGVELPLVANGKITIKTKPNLWGDMVGEVTTTAIKFPVSLGIDPINDLLADAFGSDVSVGVLTADWRISLGGRVYAKGGIDKTEDIAPFLAGVPYLRQKSPITISAQIGEYTLDYALQQDNPIEVVFDPGDPMLYVRADKIQNLKKPALGLSKHGLLEFTRQRDPAADLVEEFGHGDVVPEFFGHVYVSGSVPFKIWYVPFEAHGDSVYNLDANRDGQYLAGLFDGDDLFRANFDDLPNARTVLHDIQAGNNGSLLIKPEAEDAKIKYAVHAGEATWVFNGPAESFWFRGQRGTGGSLFDGTPLKFLDVRSTDVLEAMVHGDGHFVLRATASYGVGKADLEFVVQISNEGITAQVSGSLEWSVSVDLRDFGLGRPGGKARADINGAVGISIDGDEVYFSGSIGARGRVWALDKKWVDEEIDVEVRSQGLRFDFPLVGNVDWNPFD